MQADCSEANSVPGLVADHAGQCVLWSSSTRLYAAFYWMDNTLGSLLWFHNFKIEVDASYTFDIDSGAAAGDSKLLLTALTLKDAYSAVWRGACSDTEVCQSLAAGAPAGQLL